MPLSPVFPRRFCPFLEGKGRTAKWIETYLLAVRNRNIFLTINIVVAIVHQIFTFREKKGVENLDLWFSGLIGDQVTEGGTTGFGYRHMTNSPLMLFLT